MRSLRLLLTGIGCWLALVAGGGAASAAEHDIGVGVHYWEALDDLDDAGFDLDESGTSALLVYRVNPAGPLAFEVDLEYFGDGFAGSTSEAISPQVFVLIGGLLYGGVGAGVTYSDELPGGDDVSDPFWAARLGLAFSVLPKVRLDINGNYQAESFSALDEADTDTVTLGAHVRFRIK